MFLVCCWTLLLNIYTAQVSGFAGPTRSFGRNNHESPTFERIVQTRDKPLEKAPGSSLKGYAPQRRRAPNRKTQLRWIAQNFQKMQTEGKHVPAGITECIESLSGAQTQDEVIRIGNELSQCLVGQKTSPAVKERLIKATAMTGLFQLSLNLTNSMLSDEMLPSEITQDALCSSLRRAGRSNQIVKLVSQMGQVARKRSISISSSSFNIMLAALSDNQAKARGGLDSATALQMAWSWISEEKAKEELGVNPTSVSYATILQAAAKTGNRTLADEVWNTMDERGIRPNPFAYNAMLKLAGKGQISRDEEILQIWKRMKRDGSVQPDRYTIDLVLPALARGGASEALEVKTLLDNFVAKNSQSVVSNAFAAFLITLNNAGQMQLARDIFDRYLKPYFAPIIIGDAGSLRLVTPTCKHFNVILDGFRREIEEKPFPMNISTDGAVNELRAAAWELYNILLSSRNIEPDEFTLSTMMGLASSPEGVCQLLSFSLDKYEQTISPVLQRSAITAFGDLGDASSACWLFAEYTLTQTKPRPQTREWNVLLGALVKVSQSNNTAAIDVLTSPAATFFGSDQTDESRSQLTQLVNGVNPGEATAKILQLLVGGSDALQVPRPDSQSFCLAAAALQSTETNITRALAMFRQAMEIGVGADGRFANAILRSFGEDIESAITAWKEEIRPACLQYENRKRRVPASQRRRKGKNLVAAYDGLLNVAGRALRPDIGLRLVYAMQREGLEPNETNLNSYRSGKRTGQTLVKENRARAFARKLVLDPYESLLFVECSRYDRNDRRRAGEKRVRIIV